MDAVAFKRSIRDLQVWCSSCMVAFAGANPIAVLIGAKRPAATLIHKIAVHPDHLRQGHGRHLLTSLSSKLAILGPPRMVAEVPETNTAARALIKASGYVEEGVLTDYVLEEAGVTCHERAPRSDAGRMVIPVSIDDLAANGLLEGGPPTCWERSVETLTARKDEIEGLAVASEESIEAYVLYVKGAGAIVALRSLVHDNGDRLRLLLSRVAGRGESAISLTKVHSAELGAGLPATLGFRGVRRHFSHRATARGA